MDLLIWLKLRPAGRVVESAIQLGAHHAFVHRPYLCLTETSIVERGSDFHASCAWLQARLFFGSLFWVFKFLFGCLSRCLMDFRNSESFLGSRAVRYTNSRTCRLTPANLTDKVVARQVSPPIAKRLVPLSPCIECMMDNDINILYLPLRYIQVDQSLRMHDAKIHQARTTNRKILLVWVVWVTRE